MKVGLTDTKEGDSEDTHCDKRKEGYFEVHQKGVQEGGYDSCNQCD